MKIDLSVLNRQFQLHQNEYEKAALRVLNSGRYVLGEEVDSFENEFKDYLGSSYCVGLNSGLDALTLGVRALGIGTQDEVIIPANTYIATVLGVTANQARPIFVDADEFFNLDVEKIEEAITEKTKAIMVVHLYGQAANMEKIKNIADKYNLYLIEDCAQSHGAKFNGKMTGTFGDIGCFSFFPTKNLGAFGDAGAIVTNKKDIYEQVKMFRNYGSKIKYYNEVEGVNSRLDEIQAALLRVRLKYLTELNTERKKIASEYLDKVENPLIKLPKCLNLADHVYHQFVVMSKRRDDFKNYLEKNGIKTLIHYPIPPHLSTCYKRLGYKKNAFPHAEEYANNVLSFPIYNTMTLEEINFVIKIVNQYKG